MPVHVHALRYVSDVLTRAAAIAGVLFVVSMLLRAALDEGVFGTDGTTRTGFARFLSNLSLASGLWGLAVGLGVAQVTTYFQHRGIRKVLDRVAADPGSPRAAPVAWQHAAVRRRRAGIGVQLLGFPVILFFAFVTIVGMVALDEEPGNPLALALAIVGPLLAALGVWMVVAGSRRVTGPARDRWGHLAPASRWTMTSHDREQLGSARPAVRALGRLLVARGALCWATGGVGAVVAVLVGSGLPLAAASAGILIVALLLAVGVVDFVLALRFRPTLLREAADPHSPAPPEFLLRAVVSREVPHQAALDSLLVAAVALLVVGAAGIRTGPEYPLSDFYGIFPLLATAGGVGLLFHASGRFTRRARTRDENEYLGRRWA